MRLAVFLSLASRTFTPRLTGQWVTRTGIIDFVESPS